MWELGETVSHIADELRMTASNVKEMRRRLGLPPRKRGRPPRK
jgi:transposase